MKDNFTLINRMIAIVIFFIIFLLAPCLSYAAGGYDDVASEADTAGSNPVGKYGMIPVYGRDINDGEYKINADSSSNFFRIKEAKLIAKSGKLKAVFVIPSTSYECIYLGTSKAAAKAAKKDYIFPKVKDYESYFTIPVSALNSPISCAAFSRSKKLWYGRKILFDAGTLPDPALRIKLPDYNKIEEAVKTFEKHQGAGSSELPSSGEKNIIDPSQDPSQTSTKACDIGLDDGIYSIEVTMTGGSGRANVSSPTWLKVKDGKAYAKLLWSSSNYDYMLIGNKKYKNETTDGGNSSFTIPIPVMDKTFAVIADTTAMGDPVEITYSLTFYKNTIDGEEQVPQEAAKRVVIIAVSVIIIGGLVNIIIKKRRKA